MTRKQQYFSKYKLPSYLHDKIVLDDSVTQENDRTRLVIRNDDTQECIDKMIQESRDFRMKFWQDKDRQYLADKCKFGSRMSSETKEQFVDVLFKHRGIIGESQDAISGGVKFLACHLGVRKDADLQPVRQRSASPYQQLLWKKVIQTYIDANIVKLTTETPHSQAFLVAKKALPGIPPMKTLEDL